MRCWKNLMNILCLNYNAYKLTSKRHLNQEAQINLSFLPTHSPQLTPNVSREPSVQYLVCCKLQPFATRRGYMAQPLHLIALSSRLKHVFQMEISQWMTLYCARIAFFATQDSFRIFGLCCSGDRWLPVTSLESSFCSG